jgi:hypothetical protein
VTNQKWLCDRCCDASSQRCWAIERLNLRDDDGKFITADADENRARPHRGGNSLGKLDQSLIADRVAVGVIDRLEAIEVKHQHRRLRVDGRGQENFSQRFDEKTAIGKSGQRIMSRELFCLQFGAPAALHFDR